MEQQKELSNKWFLVILGTLLSAVVGWIFYDSHQTVLAVQQENVQRDVLKDGATGVGAQVQYLFNFPEPHLSHDLNTAQIEALSHSGAAAGENYHIPGTTVGDYKMDTLYHIRSSRKFLKSEYAIWLEDLKLEFSYTALNVYVTSKYPVDSCSYQEILAHENQHVDIHRRIYEQFEKTFRDAFSNSTTVPSPSAPLTATSEEEGKEKINQIITAITDPVFEQFKATLADEQAKIDTQESYSELHSRCPEW